VEVNVGAVGSGLKGGTQWLALLWGRLFTCGRLASGRTSGERFHFHAAHLAPPEAA
jgi:hypothetical protein